MTSCDKCGAQTFVLTPFLRARSRKVFDEQQVLPRAALSPEVEAAIPWGEHPDDNRFGVMCETCAANFVTPKEGGEGT